MRRAIPAESKAEAQWIRDVTDILDVLFLAGKSGFLSWRQVQIVAQALPEVDAS